MRAKILLLSILSFLSLPAVAQVVPCIEIKCPTNIVQLCQSTTGTPVSFTVQATNFCGTNLFVNCVPPSGTPFLPGTTTVNCTAIGSGQTNRCSFTVTITGNCQPNTNCLSIKCPSNLVVQCQVPQAAVSIGQFQLFGGSIQSLCSSNLTLSSSTTPLSSPCGGTVARTYTVIDGLSNVASCTQFITVQDTIPPVLVGVPGNTNFTCLGFLPAAFVTATDNCDGTNVAVLVTVATNGTCPRTIVRTWTARDRCSNSVAASQTITVADTIPPTIICPSNLVVQCLSDIPPCATNIFQFRARGGIATDNCGSNLLYFCSDATLGNGGPLSPCFTTITRTHTVMDACSNIASCQQTIIVRDTIPPVIVCPTNITIETCSNRPVFYQATAVDNCDTNPIVTCTPFSGSLFGPGVTVVTCQAMDRCSNRAACTFTVTAHCPSNNTCINITNRTSCISNRTFRTTFEIVNLTPGPISYVALTDLPAGVMASPDLIALDEPVPTGAATSVSVTFTVPENSLTVLTTICARVSVHNASFIECCAILHCVEVPTCCLDLSGESLSCTNTAGGGFNYSFDLRNLSGVPVKYVFLAPDPDCFDVVPNIFTLAPPLPPGGVRHFNITLNNIQSSCGPAICLRVAILDSNMVQCCSIVRCLPNPAFTRIKCPSNIVTQCQNPAGATVFYDAHASSLCGSNLPVNCQPPSGSVFPSGTTTVHCQTFGTNSDKCEFTVTVVGNCSGPCVELRCPSNIVTQCTSPSGAIVNFTVGITNPCSNVVSGFSCVPPSGSQFPIGATVVTCTVVSLGQSNRCQFPVVVTGSCSSTTNCIQVICPSNRTVQCNGPLGTSVEFPIQVVNTCSNTPVPVSCVPPSGSTFPVGTTVVNCQAGFAGTVPARCSFTITVLPGCNSDNCVDIRCPSNMTALCTTPLGAAVTYSVFATNRCSTNLVVSCIPASGSTFPAGITTVSCTAFGNGFSNRCNFTVSVVGNCPTPSPLNLVVARDGNVVELMLQTIEGVTSQIEYSDSFEFPDWKLFRTITGDGSVILINDSVSAASQRFYRLRLDP